MFRLNCVLYQLVVSIITIMLISALNLEQNNILMLCYSINSAIVFLLLIKYEIQNYVGLNLNLVLLVGYFTRLVYPEVSMSLGVINGDIYSYVRPFNVVNDYLFPTIVGINIFYMFFYLVLSKRTSYIIIDDYIKPYFLKYNIAKISSVFFVLGIIYNIASLVFPYDTISNTFARMLEKMADLAMLLQLLNTIYNYSKRNHRLLLFYVIYSVLFGMFFGFFKSGLIRPIALYCLFYFLHCKSLGKTIFDKKFVFLLSFLCIFTTMFVYPFMTTKRVVAGYNVGIGKKIGATKNYSNWAIIMDVINGKVKNDDSNSNPALGRLNAITTNAFFYKSVAKEGGHYNHDILVQNMKMLIPRFLYPEKGVNSAGLMANAYARTGSFKNFKSSNSNVYVGQFAGAYLNGGWLVVCLVMLISPFVISQLYICCLNNISNIFAVFFLAQLLMASVFAFEEVHDGGIQRCISYIVYIVFIIFTSRIIPPIKLY